MENTPPTPQPDLTIVSSRVYRGPNVWHYEPAIHLVVDLGVLEDFPTNLLPGFADALVERLPGLATHSCSRGRRSRTGSPTRRRRSCANETRDVAWRSRSASPSRGHLR